MNAIGLTVAGYPTRRRKWHDLTTWVLVIGFLLQPVLGYLVTPIVMHDVDGQQVVVCTLQGSKVVTLDIPQLADNEKTEHCSALKLYQMAGTTQVSEPPRVPTVSLYSIQSLDQTVVHSHRSLHFSAYATRAPPIA